MTKRGALMALTNPAADADAEYNRWYNDVHLPDVLSSALYDYVAKHSAFAMRTRRGAGIFCGSRCGGEFELMSPTQS
jgi:hypothetical protein